MNNRTEGKERESMLANLSKQTEIKSGKKGKHFLLHRGMGKEEHSKFVRNGVINHHKDKNRKIWSWSSDKKEADKYKDQYKGHTVSAWIHEKDIHSMPNSTVSGSIKKGYGDASPATSPTLPSYSGADVKGGTGDAPPLSIKGGHYKDVNVSPTSSHPAQASPQTPGIDKPHTDGTMPIRENQIEGSTPKLSPQTPGIDKPHTDGTMPIRENQIEGSTPKLSPQAP
jgi:hypothetical protein